MKTLKFFYCPHELIRSENMDKTQNKSNQALDPKQVLHDHMNPFVWYVTQFKINKKNHHIQITDRFNLIYKTFFKAVLK